MLIGASHLPIEEDQSNEIQLSEVSLNDSQSQYADLKFFLKNAYAPLYLNYTSKHALRLKENQYQLIDDVLFRRNYDSVLLRCLEKTKAEKVMQELHDGPAGGHFRGNITAHKILHAGYYRPTLFKYAHEYAIKCKVCQTTTGREKKATFPLQLVNIQQSFEQWGVRYYRLNNS